MLTNTSQAKGNPGSMSVKDSMGTTPTPCLTPRKILRVQNSKGLIHSVHTDTQAQN